MLLGLVAPFPLGEQMLGGLIRDTVTDEEDSQRLLDGNARAFFHL
ncbi:MULTISPECIES: hypothetical protein [Chromobacterium]|nr:MULTISPECIES: hypothetical protein [Chromobacterium]WON84293.1 hypothetical protein OK026_01895 [Chromobacterium haemolyticum]